MVCAGKTLRNHFQSFHDSIHLVGTKLLWKTRPQRSTRLVAQVTSISVRGGMWEVVFRHQRGRSTFKQGSANRMSIRIIFFTDLFQGLLKQVPYCNPLANMQISQWVEMETSWLAQILMRTAIESFPGMLGRAGNKLFHRPAAVHDCTLIFNLTVRLLRLFIRLSNADHPRWNVQPLCRDQRILRTFAHAFATMEQVIVHSKICKPPYERAQPLFGIRHRVCPRGVRDNSNRETHVCGFADSLNQNRMI